jgi:hypothetical protein
MPGGTEKDHEKPLSQDSRCPNQAPPEYSSGDVPSTPIYTVYVWFIP